MASSPTAAATRLTLPALTSPMANTPGFLHLAGTSLFFFSALTES